MSKSEHPHAEFFRAIADGEPLESWEARLRYSQTWVPAAILSANIIAGNESAQLRRKPTPKVIDWLQLGRHVPVRFGNHKCGFLDQDSTTDRFYDGFRWWQNASLDTGLWVANHDGVNPWPPGVVVDIWVRCEDSTPPSDCATPARGLRWSLKGQQGDIIMSRFHSLEEGYSFGGESCS